jgi:PAS domain S-box-containing protein
MSSDKSIRSRIETLFAGLADSIPGTGRLSPDRRPGPDLPRAEGWLWELDLDGKFTWCSPEVKRVLGWSVDEMLGRDFAELAAEETALNAFKQAIENGNPIDRTRVSLKTSSGRTLNAVLQAMLRSNASGQVIGYRGMAQIITAESPKEKSPWVVTLPTPPEQIDALSVPARAATWGDALGYEADTHEIRPITAPDALPTTEAPQSGERLTVPLRVGDQVIGVIELDQKDDGSAWSEDDRTLAQAIAQEFAVSLQDARSYQLTQQALVEMREADRLKSQFLANMSHELRTPLNSIIGFSRVILKGIDGPITENQEQDLNAIYNAGQHLLGLINNILDLSKIEAGKMELAFTEVDLAEIIRVVMATAVGLVKDKPIELIVDVPEDLPTVQADSIRIRQVLLNLVSNAAKYTEQGHIGVSARTIRRGGRSEIVIAVFDTGPGIAPADQEKIFEPFSQVDASPTRKTGGTGLGLSISRHLVELHGGSIWVESIPGEGSTFAFTLPFEPGMTSEDIHPSALLIADDTPTHIESFREMLADSSYEIEVLLEPDRLLDTATASRPACMLLDLLNEPGLSFSLIAALKSEPATQDLPVVLSGLDLNQASGVLLDVDDYLTYPIQSEALLNAFEPHRREHGLRKILLVTSQESLLDNLQKTLNDHPGLTILSAGDAPEAIVALSRGIPDLLLIDLTLSDAGALDVLAAQEVITAGRRFPVFALLPESRETGTNEYLERFAYQLRDRNSLGEALFAEQLKSRISKLTRRVSPGT